MTYFLIFCLIVICGWAYTRYRCLDSVYQMLEIYESAAYDVLADRVHSRANGDEEFKAKLQAQFTADDVLHGTDSDLIVLWFNLETLDILPIQEQRSGQLYKNEQGYWAPLELHKRLNVKPEDPINLF